MFWLKDISVLDVSPRRLSTKVPGKSLTKTVAYDVSTADFSNRIHVAFYVCIFFFFFPLILISPEHDGSLSWNAQRRRSLLQTTTPLTFLTSSESSWC